MKCKFLKSLFQKKDIFEHYFTIKVNKNRKDFLLPLEKINNESRLFLHG